MAAENISPLNGMFRVANRLHGHYPTSISKASICHRHFRRVSTNWPQLLPIAFKVASFSSFSTSAQVHIEGVSYNCDMCGKTSGSKNGLQQHKAKYHRYLELKSQLLMFWQADHKSLQECQLQQQSEHSLTNNARSDFLSPKYFFSPLLFLDASHMPTMSHESQLAS